jgi:hypothetical protein
VPRGHEAGEHDLPLSGIVVRQAGHAKPEGGVTRNRRLATATARARSQGRRLIESDRPSDVRNIYCHGSSDSPVAMFRPLRSDAG